MVNEMKFATFPVPGSDFMPEAGRIINSTQTKEPSGGDSVHGRDIGCRFQKMERSRPERKTIATVHTENDEF